MKKAAIVCVLLTLLCTFAACVPTEKTAIGISMGSDYSVSYIHSSDLDRGIGDLLSSVEESFSVRSDSSVLARINASTRHENVALSAEEVAVLKRSFEIADRSDYAFDPGVLPLVRLWGFDPPYQMNGRVPPSQQSILEASAGASARYFTLNESDKTISKAESSCALDLGAAIKGYAAERVRDYLVEKGVKEALVNVGGTIAAVGKEYRIGVKPPRDSLEDHALSFSLSEGEICATSGDYERWYEYQGVRYHHILNGKTGYPSDSGVISATVITKDGLLADALATAIVVAGEEAGRTLLDAFGAKGIIITSEKKVIPCGVSVKIKDKSYETASV